MPRRSRILPLLALLATAAAGGGLALGGAALLVGLGGGTTTTVVRDVDPPPVSQPVSSTSSLSINEIYERSAPAVVQVTSTTVTDAPEVLFGDLFGGTEQQTQQALGSGFVIDKAGHIVTNYHVVADAREIEVSFSNNDSMKARVVGLDPSTDLAVLQVDADSRALKPLALGDSDNVKVGDSVVAIGNPLGLVRTATSGIVSATQRPIEAPNGYTIDHVIQTDAPINQGNSGGPLLNERGEVIGVNSQIQTAGGSGNIGIGFAVPSNTVRTVAAQLIRGGRVDRAFLGIEGKPIERDFQRLFRLPVNQGILVERVLAGGAAAQAGLRAGTTRVVVAGESYVLGGDVIVKVDGRSITTLEQLRDRLAARKPGDTLKLEIYRGAKKMTLDVKLGRQPTSQR